MVRGQKFRVGKPVLALALCGLAHQASSQDAPGPQVGSITLTTEIEVDTNPSLTAGGEDTRISASETLGFSFGTENRSQILQASGSAGLSWTSDSTGNDVDLTEPNLRIDYLREAANADFTVNVDYWSGEIVSAFDIDPSAAELLVSDFGTLTSLDASAGLTLGRNSPAEFDLGVSYSDDTYEDTVSPLLYNRTTTRLTAGASLRLSPVTQGAINVSFSDYQAEDAAQTHTQTTGLSFGLEHELRSALSIDASLALSNRDTLNGTLPSTSGYSASLGVTQEMPRGEAFARASYDTTGAVDRTSLSFGRSLPLPAGDVSASVTAANAVGGGILVYGAAAYSQQFRNGSVSVDLSQSIATSDTDEDSLVTNFSVGYGQEINASSSFSLGMAVARSEDAGNGTLPTRSRGAFSATYNRELAQDWNLSVGYRRGFTTASDSAPAASDAVFLNVTKNFQFNF